MVDLFHGHHWISAQLAKINAVAECRSAVQPNKRASAAGTSDFA
jgi:hypothetical protein